MTTTLLILIVLLLFLIWRTLFRICNNQAVANRNDNERVGMIINVLKDKT